MAFPFLLADFRDADKNLEYRRLAMGPLLDDLQQKMQKKVEGGDEEKLKLLVYSTHDTALAGLLSSLDVFDHRWEATNPRFPKEMADGDFF